MDLEVAGFTLSIIPTASLRPHEETIPKHVDTIARELRHDTVQKDPILIDVRTRTVLDGMHRVTAFARLGLTNAICATFEYEKDSVRLGRWARVYESKRAQELERVVERVGLSRRVPFSEALSALEERRAGLAAMIGEDVLVPHGNLALADAFSVVRRIDSAGQEMGWTRKFVREDKIDVAIEDGDRLVILLHKISKEEVVSAASSGKLFPCKTSMHSVDPRPVAVNFPTQELNLATTEDLRDRLASREGKILPADSLYGGRRYKERLLLLNPND